MPSPEEKKLKNSTSVKVIQTSAPICTNSVKHYLKTLGICRKKSENLNTRTIKILPPLKLEDNEEPQADTNAAKENDSRQGLTTANTGNQNQKKRRRRRRKGKNKNQAISASNGGHSSNPISHIKNKKKRKRPLKPIFLSSSSTSSSDEAEEPVSKAGRRLLPLAETDGPHLPTSSSVQQITPLDKSTLSIDEDIPNPYQQPKNTPNNVPQIFNSTFTITSSSSSGGVVLALSSSDTNSGSSSSRQEIPNTFETQEHHLKENVRSDEEISGDSSPSTEMLMLAGKTCLQNVTSVLGNQFQETAVNCIEVLQVNNFNVRLAVKDLLSRHPEKLAEVNTDGSANVEVEAEKTACEVCLQKVISVLEDHFGKSGEESLGILHKNKYNILTTIQELQIV